MNQKRSEIHTPEFQGEVEERKRIIFSELKERTVWFIKLRWFVPPGIALGTVIGKWIGIELPTNALFLVALFIGGYNILIRIRYLAHLNRPEKQREWIRRLTRWQFGLDYVAMFLLILLTGGIKSPLIFFFIFHIIFASMLLTPRSSYGFASMVVAGMIGITLAEQTGTLTPHPLSYRGDVIHLIQPPLHMALVLGFFSASVYITAFFTSSIIQMVRKRISDLVDLSEAVRRLNQKLNTLFAMTEAVGSIKKLDRVLKIASGELCRVMDVLGVSVKLLSEDGKFLHYAAADWLVNDVLKNKVVEVSKSPLNRQVIEGKPYVTGRVTPGEMFQFGEDLAAAKVQSVLFVPLMAEEKVIGILGAYCKDPEKFTSEDVEFFRQAAGMVAVAIENARSYEAIETLIQERSWFMMQVAHNLRAPLAAILSMLEVLRDRFLGDINPDQAEQLRRIDRRTRTMISTINELLILAENRNEKRRMVRQPVDLRIMAGRIERTFQDEARKKPLTFKLKVPETLPPVSGDAAMIEQALENLISNAIKYTPAGGTVSVEFSKGSQDTVQIQISDSGIGIPKKDRPNLFNEFFRADNAKAVEEHGTGLGLSIVKEVVDQHHGRIIVESEEGLGTLFVVHFPILP